MSALLALGVLLVVMSAPSEQALGACSDPIVDPSAPIVAQVGDEFAFALESTSGTGFSWSITSDPDPAVVELLGTEPIRPAVALPGATGLQCFAFRAVGSGSTSMELGYARPFEPDVAPARTANVSVIVRSGPQVPVQLPGTR
jgi:inhibitor of cysteine peptidase